MTGFHIGQLVICVPSTSRPPPGYRPPTDMLKLVTGTVYTVRDMYTAADGTPCLRLAELVNSSRYIHTRGRIFEPGYRQLRFRPVDPKAIAVFREALAPAPRAKTDA